MIRHIWTRLQLLIAQGKALRVDTGTVQVQVLTDEPVNARRTMPYGFSHKPPAGGEVHLLFPSGNRARGIAIVHGDKRYQMDLADGEVALHDHQGNHVHIKQGGVIKAKASSRVIAETPLFEISADCKVGGNLSVAGNTDTAGNASTGGNSITTGNNLAGGVVGAAGYAGPGGSGAATINADITINGTSTANDHISGGKSGKGHKHTDAKGRPVSSPT